MYVDPALVTHCFSTGRSALRLFSEQGELLSEYPRDEFVVGVCALSVVAISLFSYLFSYFYSRHYTSCQSIKSEKTGLI